MAGPVMQVVTQDGGSADLPLIEEHIEVVIDQGHAQTEFRHTFQNETTNNLEGSYRITLGAIATATGFAYYNGETKIVGEIFEKEAARQVYETVTGSGRDPGLLEQTGEGQFSFRVAPITPGEKKRVEVGAAQWLRQSGETIEYHVPLGRPRHTAHITLVDTRPIGKIWSTTHDLKIQRTSRGAKITLDGAKTAQKGIVVRYQVQESDYFLSTAIHRTAGQDAYVVLSLATPNGAKSKKAPRDVTFVIDRSGSMSGAPLEAARRATEGVLKRLSGDDRVNVISFDDGVDALFDQPRPVKGVRDQALTFIQGLSTGGGTDLALALREATARQSNSGRTQVLLFLTDGQSDAQAALEAAKKAPKRMQLYAVGIGAGVDRPLLSKLSRENRGRFTFVSDEANLERDVDQLYSRIEAPVLSDLEVSVEGAKMHRLYPRRAPDLFEKDQLTFAMRLRTSQSNPEAFRCT
jgi:Ca-activated chloride channel family protein